MTECEYSTPLLSFKIQHKEQPTIHVPLLERGKAALEEINKGMKTCIEITYFIRTWAGVWWARYEPVLKYVQRDE